MLSKVYVAVGRAFCTQGPPSLSSLLSFYMISCLAGNGAPYDTCLKILAVLIVDNPETVHPTSHPAYTDPSPGAFHNHPHLQSINPQPYPKLQLTYHLYSSFHTMNHFPEAWGRVRFINQSNPHHHFSKTDQFYLFFLSTLSPETTSMAHTMPPICNLLCQTSIPSLRSLLVPVLLR